MQFADTAILIFAKAPQPGQVKTRLVPLLGEAGAARLHRELVVRQFHWLKQSGLAEVACYCAPDTTDPLFLDLRQQGVRLELQVGDDLGERMFQAASRELELCRQVVLLGCDCPAMDAAYLGAALHALHSGSDVVLGPAEDGGYVLMGLRKVARELFAGIAWGSDRVLEDTCHRIDRMGWRRQELPVLWDLDRPRDLERYRRWLSDCAVAAPGPAQVG